MQKIKFKSFVLIIPILIFSGISFYFFSLIFTTLKFDISKNKSSQATRYSYVILSADNKILSKLSRKFEIDNSNHKIPFFLKHSFISSEDKIFYKHNGIDLKSISRALIKNLSCFLFSILLSVSLRIKLISNLSFKKLSDV